MATRGVFTARELGFERATGSGADGARAFGGDVALLVIDVQNDFVPPRGALAVDGGDEIVGNCSEAIVAFERVVFSQDYHPEVRARAKIVRSWSSLVMVTFVYLRNGEARPRRLGRAMRLTSRVTLYLCFAGTQQFCESARGEITVRRGGLGVRDANALAGSLRARHVRVRISCRSILPVARHGGAQGIQRRGGLVQRVL